MIGSRATKHKPHAYWDRDRHIASGSAFWWQVHISFSVNQRQTVTCPPRLQNGAPFHRSARPGVSACFEGSLRQWHQKIYTREGGLSFIFPSMRQAKKLNSTHRGEYLPLETHHKTENYKVLLKPQREVQTPSAAFYWKNLWGRPRFLFSRA